VAQGADRHVHDCDHPIGAADAVTRLEDVMRKLTGTFVLIPLVLAFAWTAAVSAKPGGAPVRVEHADPPPLVTGEQATTVLTFRALADIDRLEVSLRPMRGLEIVSEPTQAAFTDVKKGAGLEVSVTVRLTGPNFGRLAITYETRQGQTNDSGATTILYGTVPR
jgi:hypothetical protein